ncbi:MAG: nitroreductase [Candidatus Paceibacteria bacterium]|jgi:nitroreductase
MPPEDPSSKPPQRPSNFDVGPESGSHVEADFWEVLYGRRSVRRFKSDPVRRELTNQVMHAGIWAPSSCNYQMWDVVAVDDAEVNADLAQLSTQLGNAPTNLVVSYGRDFSEEGWANIQSASAMIQNMSLAAHALGLGTFWITQMGDRELLREKVGLPVDRLVVAVLALGYPEKVDSKAPPRRPIEQVTHYNRYVGQVIPSSVKPEDWTPELLKVYQRARVLNGLRHNKPRAWEVQALDCMLSRLLPDGANKPETNAELGRWLDVLPLSGIVTERLSRERKGFQFDVVERSLEVAAFAAKRTRPKGACFAWPESSHSENFGPPEPGSYDVVSCLYRLENLPQAERKTLLDDMHRWLRPGGLLILAFVSRRSFHQTTESMRRRRGGPGGVEYVLSPDPNIGPFEALDPGQVPRLVQAAGFQVQAQFGTQACPPAEELAFRTRNFGSRAQTLVRLAAWVVGRLTRLPGMENRRGRFQFLSARKTA